MKRYLLIFFTTLFCFSCSLKKINITSGQNFYLGADLSYVNEMENCGASYKNEKNEKEDVFKIFKNKGTNLIRVRKWHTPSWTNYSDYKDVEKTIKRAKDLKMDVLLDFHYSDDWADPNKQVIPKAWLPIIDNLPILGDSIYNYTFKTLKKLDAKNLLPEMVQVGNETNIMILQKDDSITEMDWRRNSFLLNKGIKAVRDIAKELNKNIEIMLHIAQPENGLWWFEQAKENGISDYDWIGLSYYPKWSKYNFQQVSNAFKTLIDTYQKKLMVVETAYPFTLKGNDSANNILANDALITNYAATEEGQLNYLLDLKKVIKNSGGLGLVYWEPAWVTNNCATRWGKGSHWENATLFNFEGIPTQGFKFYNSDD